MITDPRKQMNPDKVFNLGPIFFGWKDKASDIHLATSTLELEHQLLKTCRCSCQENRVR